ncbi:WD40-repeat-containing domain superfamily [Arabidopsis thaliana x Arabidopsis arenosa]|uniref:WD40-repeat-containing domain superfamily n=1 Tax=Arabidopsis thaliana x Arabidopsis arenosa TaxID=1240361 RepID=A0A8T1ZMZ5_9BRAS|nr:WD40-repeat-containing domain superfamily [Arabidopsis thaliana x Arabidopsis arenosa]
MARPRRRNTEIGDGFTEIFNREIGFSHPITISRRISASEGIVKKLDLYGKLNGHEGCVNAVEFNSTGDVLVSGSDDRQIMLWNWLSGSRTLSYPSGHCENVFQTKFIPFTDDRTIITSGADGQVRLGQILENGKVETKRLGRHHGRVYKLAVLPGDPNVFYSCGEDGFVQHFDIRSNSATMVLYSSPFTQGCRRHHSSSRIRLNSIAIDPRNSYYLAVGGSDEYARVYDTRRGQLAPVCRHVLPDAPVNTFCPRHLRETNSVHITGLAYSKAGELLVSYNDELIYLFEKNMGYGPSPVSISPEKLQEMEEPQVYTGHRNAQTVKGVNFFGPNDEYVTSGSDCGHIFIWKKKGGKLVRAMVGDRRVVNQLESHPHIPLLASCGIEKSVKLWTPMSNDVLSLPEKIEKVMELNRVGREDQSRVTLTPDVIMHVLRLQRRQTSAFTERRYVSTDIGSDEGNDAHFIANLVDNDEESSERECIVS